MTPSKMTKLKIVKNGRDIDSSDPQDFVFNSDFPTMCVKSKASFEITTNTGTSPDYASASYSHNFGYIPFFMAFTRSYLSENYIKWFFADYVALDVDFLHHDEGSGALLGEELYAIVDEQAIEVQAKLETSIGGVQSGIEHTYTIDVLLFMEEVELI